MSTMKDVAREANVSVATVSYYMNHKNVSEKNAIRIAAAIEKLNYVVQGNGRDLRKHSRREVGIVFPCIDDPYLEKVISSIKGYLNHHNIGFSLELSDDNPENELKSVLGFIGRRFSGIILYSCQPKDAQVFSALAASGIPYVLIDRKPDDYEGNYVCCDNQSLFYDLTKQLLRAGKQEIALVTGPLPYNECAEAVAGYERALKEANLAIDPRRVIHTRTLRESGFRAGIDLIERSPRPPEAILTTSFKLAEGLRYALEINRIVPGEATLVVSAGDLKDDVFYSDRSIIKTSRSAFKIGENAGHLLLKNIRSPIVFEKQQIRVKDANDAPKLASSVLAPRASPHAPRQTIRVLLLDDFESVNALQRLLVDFYAKESITIEPLYVHPEHAYDYLTHHLAQPGHGIDAFLFDSPWLSYLVDQGHLLCLDAYFNRYQVTPAQYVDGIIEHGCQVDGRYFALPYIASTQLMFYRKDLFQNEQLMRQYEKQYRIPLMPPKTWLDYYTISRFFTRGINPSSPVSFGHAMDIPYTEQLLCSFWPRLWAYGGHIADKRGRIHLCTPAAKKAVRNLLECVTTAHPDLMHIRPTNAVDKLLDGEVAMLTTFFNYATGIADPSRSPLSRKIGYTSIPGSMPVLGGWCFGISKDSPYPDAAFRFIQWSSSAEIAVSHTILGGQSPQRHTYDNYDIVSLYPWLTKVAAEFTAAVPRMIPHTPGLSILSEKALEELLARQLYPLIEMASSGALPDHMQIESALLAAQEEIDSLLVRSLP